MGNLGDLPNLDGHWISGQNIIYPLFDRLVELDASLTPHPALAESWEVNPDYTQITFQLLNGVRPLELRATTFRPYSWYCPA